MQMNRRLMAVLALLIIAMMIPACAGAVVDYTVDKPAGYTTSMKYPVIYVMPEDGYARDNSGLTTRLLAAMNNGDGAKMLIVRPTFTAGMDLFAEMAALVQDVDANYSTIPDAAHRAIAGVGTGGYLAYVLSVTDSAGALRTAPDLFVCVGSIDGNFVSNPWHSTYADIYAKASALSSETSFNNVFNKFYTYMDTPVESQFADDVNGTNDLGELFINRKTGSDVHEYTARLGGFTDAFLAESASRMLDRFSRKMMTGIFSGFAELTNATLPQSTANASVEYRVKVGADLSAYASEPVTMKVIAKVVDPATGDVLGTGTATHSATAGSTYTGTIAIPNKVRDLVSNVEIAVEVLNDQIDVTTAYLVRYKAPTSDHVELMGDWYFNYTGTGTKLDCTTLTAAEFETWSTALPALMNWGDGYGNISDPGWYGDWFPFMITGSGYYAKTFTVPADFDVTAPKLSIGYVDDRCEVFLNGVCVGRTGMDASGNPTGDTTWAVYSCFDVDPSLINVGGENTVIVRAWNDTPYGAGGWYAGPVGLYSAEGFASAGAGDDSARFYEETFHSDALGADNKYLIYLPEDYNKSEYYYPTLYLLHQFNSDHTSYRADKIDQLMDEAIRDGLFKEMIVVIPNSDENSWWKGKWENMVTQDLIPHIEKNYRAIPDARYRMTAGCSMGGQGAFSVALCNPQMFTGAAAFFGAFDYGNGLGRINPVTLAGNEGAEYMDYFSMAFICGNQDDYQFGQGKIQMHQVLKDQGVEHYFFIENGKHDSKFYVPYFKDTIAYVRGNMPRDNALSAPKYSVSCDVLEENTLRITVTADESIKDSFLQFPDSSYSSGYEPSITVPFVVRFDADESSKAAYVHRFNATFTEDSLTWEENIDLSQYGANARVRSIKTQFLGRDTRNGNAKLDTLGFNGNNTVAQLPSTGDESNIFFAAAALMTSVAALFVLRRRNA